MTDQTVLIDDSILYMPPFQTPVKAKKDTPCNGCGLCCHMSICKIGQHFFGKDKPAPCPGIIYEDGKVRCGVVMAERELLGTDDFGKMLGIDKGCCSDDLEEIAA